MEESKLAKMDARTNFMLYGFMFCTLLAAIGCIKHLIRFELWHTLIFAVWEDIAIIVLIARLLPYRRPDHDLQITNLALQGMGGIMLIGIISEIGMGVMR